MESGAAGWLPRFMIASHPASRMNRPLHRCARIRPRLDYGGYLFDFGQACELGKRPWSARWGSHVVVSVRQEGTAYFKPFSSTPEDDKDTVFMSGTILGGQAEILLFPTTASDTASVEKAAEKVRELSNQERTSSWWKAPPYREPTRTESWRLLWLTPVSVVLSSQWHTDLA